MQQLEVAAARYRLGRQTGEALRDLGETLLADGQDAAVPLAIIDDLSMADVGPVFERVCQEIGQVIPSLDEAIDIVIAAVLAEIAQGAIAPEAGLQRLMDDVVRPHVDAGTTAGSFRYVGESHRLQHLVGAYWGYDELRSRPHEVSIDGKFGDDAVVTLDAQVIEFARDWLAQYTATA